MNDIKLVKSREDKYDWAFGADDLREVITLEQTKNAVRHAILLHKNELDFFPYVGKGSNVDLYWKASNLEKVLPQLQEEIKITCEEVDGVESASVQLSLEGKYIIISELSILRDDGREVELYAT